MSRKSGVNNQFVGSKVAGLLVARLHSRIRILFKVIFNPPYTKPYYKPVQRFSKILQHRSKSGCFVLTNQMAHVRAMYVRVIYIFTHAFNYAILIGQKVTSAF